MTGIATYLLTQSCLKNKQTKTNQTKQQQTSLPIHATCLGHLTLVV